MKNPIISTIMALTVLSFPIAGQSVKGNSSPALSNGEQELRAFYDAYAEDLRNERREAIADRYDSRGYYRVGNGMKIWVAFDDNKKYYLTQWSRPKSFAWKDMSFEVLSPTSAAVAGTFEWQRPTGEKGTYSYSASLIDQSGKWRIRVEDESSDPRGYTTTNISGDRNTPGVWKYSLTAQPGASIAAHRHTSAMTVTVKSGRKFILIGDLDTAKVQRFDTGSTFVIPANTWHMEWWEDETVEDIEITAPTRTERATPSTPRK